MSARQVSSVVEKTLAITELREAIISHLHSKDVILAQRVSKVWYATIKGSLILQNSLGFAPNCQPPAAPSDPDSSFKHKRSPELMDGASAIDFLRRSEAIDTVVANPLLTALCKREADSKLFLTPSIGLKALMKNESASWNKLFLTQPPITSVYLAFLCPCTFGGSAERELQVCPEDTHNEEGVTMRDLFRQLRKIQRQRCRDISAFWFKT